MSLMAIFAGDFAEFGRFHGQFRTSALEETEMSWTEATDDHNSLSLCYRWVGMILLRK